MAGPDKHLVAKKTIGSTLIPVNDIWFQLDDCNDLVFSYKLVTNLNKNGLVWPILVCNNMDFQRELHKVERRNVPITVHQTWRCLIGNNRLDYAIAKNFTHISAVPCRSMKDFKSYMDTTFMEPSSL